MGSVRYDGERFDAWLADRSDRVIRKACGLRGALSFDCADGYDSVDMVGYNCVPSSRRYRETAVIHRCVMTLPDAVVPVGVCADLSVDEIVTLAMQTGIGVRQLHGEHDSPATCVALRAAWLGVIRALPYTRADEWRAYLPSVSLFVIDAMQGGSGSAYDYTLLRTLPGDCPFVVAGGVRAETIDEIVDTLPHARGVDIASGIETDGEVDEHKIAQIGEVVRGRRAGCSL